MLVDSSSFTLRSNKWHDVYGGLNPRSSSAVVKFRLIIMVSHLLSAFIPVTVA